MGGELSEGSPRVENMSDYEREKINATLVDAKHLVAVIENYLKTVDYCDQHGIPLLNRPSLSDLRVPGGKADPVGPLRDLSVAFESGMTAMARNINVSHKPGLEASYNEGK